MSSSFEITFLDGHHPRADFDCGSEPLNRYFREQVTQDIRRRVAACFVIVADEQYVAGYYTLASASLMLKDLPPQTIKKLPRYPTVPAVRMGRLAVDQKFQRRGLGGVMLADALKRSIYSEIASYALVVDAKDEAVAAFYRHHGFIALPDKALTLFLPLDTVRSTQK